MHKSRLMKAKLSTHTSWKPQAMNISLLINFDSWIRQLLLLPEGLLLDKKSGRVWECDDILIFMKMLDVIAIFAVLNSYHRYKSYVGVVSKFWSFLCFRFPPFCGFGCGVLFGPFTRMKTKWLSKLPPFVLII